MKIYVTHSSGFDYKNELYQPLRQCELNNVHEITLPHEYSTDQFSSREHMKNYNLILAEVSYPSTGQGIELGWADSNKIPIICFYNKAKIPSGSLKVISNTFIEYENSKDMINKLTAFLSTFQDSKHV